MKNIPASLLALALSAILFQGCVSKKKLKAYLWLNNAPIPKEICDREPVLKDYGLYRRLNNGSFEFVSFCELKSKEFLSMYRDDLENLLHEQQQQSDSEKAIEYLE